MSDVAAAAAVKKHCLPRAQKTDLQVGFQQSVMEC